MNFIRIYKNLLRNFIFALLFLLEDYDQGMRRVKQLLEEGLDEFH